MTTERLDDERFAELVWALDHADARNRAYAAVQLGRSRDPRALDLLLDALGRERERWAAALPEPLRRAPVEVVRRTSLWSALRPFAEGLGALGPPAVSQVIAALRDGDASVRAAAALALGDIGGHRATDALIPALGDVDALVRMAAATALGTIRTPQAMEPLMRLAAARSELYSVRGAAVEALCRCCHDHPDERMLALLVRLLDEPPSFPFTSDLVDALPLTGEPIVPGLIEVLKDETHGIAARSSAATALGRVGDRRAVRPLLDMLANHNDRVCQAAGHALAALHTTEAVPRLIQLLRLWDEPERDTHYTAVEAARALGDVGDGRAVEPLLALLDDPAREGRKRLAEALGKLGDARALEPLAALLRDPEVRLRSYTAAALGRLGNRRGVEPLVAALADELQEVREHAAEALGALADPRAVEPLIGALRSDHTYVRWRAIDALQRIGGAAAVDALCEALRDPDESARRFAADALGTQGDTHAMGPLLVALDDASADVRLAAIEALGQCGDARAESALKAIARGQGEMLLWRRDAARAALEAIQRRQQGR